MWIAPGSVLTRQTLNAMRRFECRNPFLRRHNLLRPELRRACGTCTACGSVSSPSSAAQTPIMAQADLGALEVDSV